MSSRYDLNGICEARGVEIGGNALLNPNHMLYRPLGALVYYLAGSLGYEGRAIYVLQHLTAVCSALCAGFMFLLLLRWTRKTFFSFLVSVYMMTTWAFWTFSTDAYYMTPAALTVTLMIYSCILKNRLTAIIMSIFASTAILFWQANIFLIPIVLGIYYLNNPDRSSRDRIKNLALFLSVLCLIIAAVYLFTGIFGMGFDSISDFKNWILSHSSGKSGGTVRWGRWGWARPSILAKSALGSHIPIQNGMQLSQVLDGKLPDKRMLSWLALVLFTYMGLVTIIKALLSLFRGNKGFTVGSVALAGYLLFLPFLLWWDPYEPKWFVIPNILVLFAYASFWKNKTGNVHYIAMILLIVFNTLAVYQTHIQPRHENYNREVGKAYCYSRHATERDLYISSFWNWFNYAEYFDGFKGRTINLVTGPRDPGEKLERVRRIILETQARGGRVLMQDLRSFPKNIQDKIYELTGLTADSFEVFTIRTAFRCSKKRIVELGLPEPRVQPDTGSNISESR